MCKCMAMLLIPASTVEMLCGTSILYSSALSVIYLKRKLYYHQRVGMIIISIGVALVGLSITFNNEASSQKRDTLISGILLLQLGILLGAVGFIFEEKMMKNQRGLDPTLMVGYEGLYGCFIWFLLLPILYFIPCKNPSFCSNGRLEDVFLVFEDYSENPSLFYQSLAIAVIILFSSICGMATTKYGSASQRITILLARNLVVWIFFMTIPIAFDSKTDQHIYSETFSIIKLSGFLILAYGILVFNQICSIPFKREEGFSDYSCVSPSVRGQEYETMSPSKIYSLNASLMCFH